MSSCCVFIHYKVDNLYRDNSLRKFAMDVKEDKQVDETVIISLKVSNGWKSILEMIAEKTDSVDSLNRAQLLSLYRTLFTIQANSEDEVKEPTESLLSTMRKIVQRLGCVSWTRLGREEADGINLVVGTIEGLPPFVENIIKHLLSKEGDSLNFESVDVNSNWESDLVRREDEQEKADNDDSDDVQATVDKVLDSMGLVVNSELDTVQKLNLLLKNAEVVNAVKVLEPLVKDLKKITQNDSRIEAVNDHLDVKEVMGKCRSVCDILNSFPEYEKWEEGWIKCFICKTKFRAEEDGNSEEDSILTRRFRNLKKILVCHLESSVHKAESAKKFAVEALEDKQESRVNSIGLVLGCICYLILKRGRPYEDYTDFVSLLSKFGVDVGEINHSFNFVGKFRAKAAEGILRRWKDHLSSRCPQTGCLPPCKILGDMATWQHWTRQAVGLAVLMPGSKQLIQTILLGFPRICRHDGDSLSKNIAEITDPFIKSEQYLGTSFDGAYRTASVGQKLDVHFGVEGVHDWDPVHAAATIDTAMRSNKESKKFGWLNKVTKTISSCNKLINWGAEWDRFFKVRLKQ